MIDQIKKKSLIQRIKDIGYSNDTETILTVDEYFDGYDDPWCFVCANNVEPVSTREFKSFLENLKAKGLVYESYIRFYDFENALRDEDCWINSDMVWLVTQAQPSEVEKWFDQLEGTEAYVESELSNFVNPPEIPEGYQLVGIGWD